MNTNTKIYQALKNAETFGFNTVDMEAVYKLLLDNIREEENKKSGVKAKDETIIKRITQCKDAKNNKMFSEAHEFTFNNTTMYGFLEGHYILASTNNFNYAVSDNPFKIAGMISGLYDTTESITLDKSDISTFKKTNKQKAYIINNDNYKLGINPQYIIDAIDFTNTNTIYFVRKTSKTNSIISPVFLYNDDYSRIAMILPVNC